jgi:PAS domain S-box-containing protein
MATESDEPGGESAGRTAVFETSPDPILMVDGETGAVVDANESAVEFFGMTRTRLCERTVGALCQNEDGMEALLEAALAGESVQREWEIDRADGRRWVSVTVAGTDDGQALVFVRDSTERRDRLEANDAILTQLTETTDDVFWLFDDEFSELQFVNDAYEEIWGQSVAALEADPMAFMEGVHPDDRELVASAIERLQGGESTEHEYRVNPDEGYERWVWVRGEPIIGTDGEVERVAGFARDITERKRREQNLERSERQFEAVFNDPQLLVGLLDIDGTVRRVNETALEHAGTDRSTVEGTPFWETPWWSHDEDAQAELREWLDRAANGEYVEFEASHPLPAGGEMSVEGTVRPVLDEDGSPQSLITSARDVTERVTRERQLEESNARLEKFAYVASHDLQEPLRTISNYVELLAEEYGEQLDEEAKRFIDVVVTGSDRMQSMINGLLDYSRVTTRGDEFRPVDTEKAVADVVSDLSVMLEEHGGTVETGELPTIDADGSQFRQVVQNLVKNALEHAESERVEIRIRATERADKYHFEVTDDGPGIEPNRHEKIFRIFKSGTQYQTSSQAKGIGLAICDNIVSRHGGDIWVESDPGDGATFVFTIAKQQ